MKTDISTEPTVKKLSYEEILYQAQEAPKLFVSLSAAEQDDVNRDPGLLLTKAEIINIKKYETLALALPHTLEDVRNYLDYGDIEDVGNGLKYENFLDTFSCARNHALDWNPLYDDMKLTGTKLRIFAHDMIVYGDAMGTVCDGIKALKELDKLLDIHKVETLAQLKEIEVETGEKFPGIELEKDDKKDLGAYLKKIFDSVDKKFKETKAVHTRLTDFSDELRINVLPKITKQINLITASSIGEDIKQLKDSIEQRSIRIEEKSKEYKAMVEKSIGTAVGGGLPGLIMGIYMGVEADGVRVERNKLIQEQEVEIEKLSKEDKTQGSLHSAKLRMEDLKFAAFNADAATKNLRHIWNVIYTYMQSSNESIENIDDALSLGVFMTEFKRVVDPWRYIEAASDLFINVFNEADEDYKKLFINNNN